MLVVDPALAAGMNGSIDDPRAPAKSMGVQLQFPTEIEKVNASEHPKGNISGKNR